VAGVLFDKSSAKYLQKAPLAHKTTKSVVFEVIIYKSDIYIIQDNLIFSKLFHEDRILQEGEEENKKGLEWNIEGKSRKQKQQSKAYLSLEACNCVAQIEKIDSNDFVTSFRRGSKFEISQSYLRSRIEDLEIKEFKQDCSICYEEIKELKILDCDHHFCEKCIGSWLFVNSTCPICRRQIKQLNPI
jgi:Zinc finger, C3HC4 type (RING finger)